MANINVTVCLLSPSDMITNDGRAIHRNILIVCAFSRMSSVDRLMASFLYMKVFIIN